VEAADAGLATLQAMYQHWGFFRSLIDTAQISVGTADMQTARLYADLVVDRKLARRVFNAISREHTRTNKALLAVTCQQRILDNLPVLRDSILFRNPAVDPMHAIQVHLLDQIRSAAFPEGSDEGNRLRYALDQTINGIAAGLQSTG
jgi:phosphoenolpyruvate carboxylase